MGILDVKIEVMRELQWKKRTKSIINRPQQQPSGLSNSVKYLEHELYRAATQPHTAVFMRILQSVRDKRGQNVSTDDVLHGVSPLGNTLLHVAAAHGNLSVLKTIVEASASLLFSKNYDGDTPLHMAAEAGHMAVLRELVARLRDANAADDGQMMQNKQGNTALHKALISFKGTVAEYLVISDPRAMFCLNNEEKSGFYLAAEAGFQNVIKSAFESCNESMNNCNPLIYEMLKGKPPIHAAVLGKQKGALHILVEKVPSLLQSRDEEGRTPYHLAAFTGYLYGVEYLLSKVAFGAVTRDHFGFFPIHWAAMQGHVDVIELLLKYSPDPVEFLDSKRRNVLHTAAESGSTNVVIYLLKNDECKKLINARDQDGNTPLHLATMNWHPSIVSALTWNENLDLKLLNNGGLTALDAAEFYIDGLISFQQRLTWAALAAAGAPRAPPLLYNNSAKQLLESSSPPGNFNLFKDRVNTLLVVATLIATITFAAGFTVPGGYNADSNKGQATLLHQNSFSLFIICDTISMCSAIIVAVSMIWAQLGDLNLVLIALQLGLPLLGVSLTVMSVAFMAGIYTVVRDLAWLGLCVAIIGAIFLVIVAALSFPLCFPIASDIFVIRYISYYPFQLLMYVTTSKNSRN